MVKKTLVIGANSFSGQDFIDLLLEDENSQVIGMSRSPERSALFLRYKLRDHLSNYSYYQLDLNRDMNRILELIDAERPTCVVNFAAQSEVGPSWEHPEHWFDTNCVSLAKLVNHICRKDFVQKYLHVSSPEVYGTCTGVVREDAPFNPSTPYAASKAAADMLLSTYRQQYGLPVLTVRSTNVYGARQQLFKIIPRSFIRIRLGETIHLHGGGSAVKSYIHVRDISKGELAILEHGRIGQTYHLSPEHGISVKDLVQRICNRMGASFEEATNVVEERPGQDAAYVINSDLARSELKWAPEISLDEGIDEVCRWVDDYWDDIVQQPLEYMHKP
jgi:dTDP-glucose 4,6-dehydratase